MKDPDEDTDPAYLGAKEACKQCLLGPSCSCLHCEYKTCLICRDYENPPCETCKQLTPINKCKYCGKSVSYCFIQCLG